MSITSPESRGDDFFCPTNSTKPKRMMMYNNIKRRQAHILEGTTSKGFAFLFDK